MISVSGRILVIGELNVDLVASGLLSEPKLGQEILASGFRVTLGSASAIFACGMARLGHPVTFYSKVGPDDFGRFCLKALEQAGISTARVIQSPGSTTGVTIVLSTAYDRALVTCLGAIADFRYEEVSPVAFAGHQHLHLTSYFLQHGLRSAFITMMQQARQSGLTVSFDPNSDPAQAWGPEIWSVFAEADVVFLNEMEALQVTRQTDLRSALDVLGRRAACTVIKQGKRGATAIRGSELVHIDGFAVQAVDTTGAGDSFAAGFVHAMLLGKDLERCLLIGNAAGALSTLEPGGTGGQPDQAALARFCAEKAREADNER